MSDFLLIHGGSHGAWCWEGVIGELALRGHKGHALDLPGGGDDRTPRAIVTFDTCLSAVNDFIVSESLRDFILVGHSLAGILLPDIVASNPERVCDVVFIAAFILGENERAIDFIDPRRVPEYRSLADASPEKSVMLSYEAARERFFSDLDEAGARAAFAKLTPQPLLPYLAPVRHGAHSIRSISRYIICRDDRNLPYDRCRRFAEKLGGTTEEIDGGHDVMLSNPAKLAHLLSRGRIRNA